MNRPQVVGHPTSQQHMQAGINKMADLLAPTLGPTGGHIISETDRSEHYELLTDSALMLRRVLSLGSPQLDIGAMTVRSVVWRVGQRAGDGGATTAVLMRAIFNEGVRLVAADINAMQLNRGLRLASDLALDALRAQARPVQSADELAAVARTITQEESLSAVLGELSFLLGPDAHVTIEKFVAPYLQRRYIAGAHYAAQIASMYFYTDDVRKAAVVAAPLVALVDDKISETDQVLPLMEATLAAGRKALVIVAKEVTGSALSLLVHNQQQPADKRKLQLMAVKLTSVGDEQRQSFVDLALMTGATLLGPHSQRVASTARLSDLGEAQRVEFADKAVTVVANRGERDKIQTEVGNLRKRLSELPLDDDDRPKLVRRLATLAGGLGELKIGANTKSERAMLENQAERALKVLSAAQRNGVVPGAGASLYHCGQAIRAALDANSYPDDVRHGMGLLVAALSAPLSQIVKNTGIHEPALIRQRLADAGPSATYDALRGEVIDAYAGGVLDVTDVVATVLQSAVSGAMMALSTDAIVYHRKPEQVLTPG